MKYSIVYSLLAATLLFASCTAKVDITPLGTVLAASEVKIKVVQTTPGSNAVTLLNSTKGVVIYFDWGTGAGKSSSMDDSVHFYVPFKGTFKITYTAFCAGGTVTDSTTYTIASNDNAYFDTDPAWKGLTKGGTGQTWVWALDIPGKVIAGNGPLNCKTPGWWNVNTDPGNNAMLDFNASVYCDLIGGANFVQTKGDGSVVKGFFNVLAPFTDPGEDNPVVPYSVIQVSGGAAFPWPNGNGVGKYHITRMTPDLLSVHDYNNYNIGVYKRKGFIF